MSDFAPADQDPGGQIHVTLPDGSRRPVATGGTGADVAAAIGPGLARAALAVRLDGRLADLLTPIDADVGLQIVTRDDAARDEVLELLRHDAAHVLAEAVQELYPDTQVTFGPAIEDGFFYDFARDEPFTPEDLERIEARMHEIVARDEPIRREVWSRNQAIGFFKDKGEHYKAEHIESLPAEAEISIYRQGDWLDLCTGPHLPSTGRLGDAFRLTKVSGAYWRGDAKNQQLQRIYGTCWRNDKELAAYLHRLEEAAKRDHRRLGREMGLFHFQEEAAGSVFWHPKGWVVYRQCEDYIRQRLDAEGYQEIKTPQLYDFSLWERSGHADKFADEMFTLGDEGNRALGLKPMNCPGHVQVFRQGLKSYRDLPLRLAEFGACMRNEPSGALHGMMRVRAFTQDDAHIFCTEDQIVTETKAFCGLLSSIYRDFGFDDFFVKFSDRPPVRAGSDATWDKAEGALREATEAAGLDYQLNPGEGAFYGPKLEFVLRDAIGRDWQCGTLQVDFVLPERLDASYVGEDGGKHRPVMLHRAILGSFERFIGILVEHYAGHLPLWLAPTQVVVATITQDADDYANRVVAACQQAGLRVDADLRNEKINYKVREHTMAKIPVMLVVGRREADDGTVAVRRVGGSKQQVMDLDEVVNGLKVESLSPATAPQP